MKKILSLALAASMIAATAVTSFAAVHGDTVVGVDDATLYLYDSDNGYYLPHGGSSTGADLTTIAYGGKLAYKLAGSGIGDKTTVNKYRAYAEWKHGDDLANKVAIEYVKYQSAPTKYWFDKTKIASPIDITDKGVTFTPDSAVNAAATSVTLDGSFWDTITQIAEVSSTTSKTTITTAIDTLIDTLAAPGASASGTTFTITTGASTPNAGDAMTPAEITKLKAVLKELAKAETTNITTPDKPLVKKPATYAYDYFAVVSLKDSTSTSVKDIAGNIKVAKTSSAAKNQTGAALNISVGQGTGVYGIFTATGTSIDYSTDLGNGDIPVIDFKTNDIQDIVDINFKDEVLFCVDVTGMNRINVKYSTAFNTSLAAKYNTANLNFYKWTANPIFNRTGDLYFYTEDKDAYLYEIVTNSDGEDEIKEVNFVYDEDYEALKVRTRKLGRYVVSDIELVPEIDEPTVPTTPETPVAPTPEDPIKGNPNTGR